MLAVEGRQLRGLSDAAPKRREASTKDIGNVDEFLFFADRAINVGKFTHVFRRPNQLRVGIANIDAA